MLLKSVYLQNFRSYKNTKFDFGADLTVVIGPNTAGKTNLSEAIHLLSTGKSFRTSQDGEMIAFGQDVGRVGGMVDENAIKLEVVLANASAHNGRFGKKFLVNGVAKSRANFVGHLPLVLFRPEELDIVIDSPSTRRNFLDNVLETVDKDYLYANSQYQKALRQRNALLDIFREQGRRNEEQFDYWDSVLIDNGQILTKKRQELIDFFNTSSKDVFDVRVHYDHSTISKERLLEYAQAEIGAGNTLVGPHRDDFYMTMTTPEVKGPNLPAGRQDTSGVNEINVKHFGSRGQQRLVVLQLKLLQIAFIKMTLGENPLLVLDDIFSELDSSHIKLVMEHVKGYQVVLTTTHKEFLPSDKHFSSIELDK